MLRPALIVAAVAAVGLSGCAKRFEGAYGTSGHDLNPDLAVAADTFATDLQHGAFFALVGEFGAPDGRDRLARFVVAYGGHETRYVRMRPSDDSTATQTIAVTCAEGRTQRIDIFWSWADGWRAAPAGVVTADDEVRELPGCG